LASSVEKQFLAADIPQMPLIGQAVTIKTITNELTVFPSFVLPDSIVVHYSVEGNTSPDNPVLVFIITPLKIHKYGTHHLLSLRNFVSNIVFFDADSDLAAVAGSEVLFDLDLVKSSSLSAPTPEIRYEKLRSRGVILLKSKIVADMTLPTSNLLSAIKLLPSHWGNESMISIQSSLFYIPLF
jgi:hypothetical protein